jgi:predicted Zn-dependent protease with MMP-like domain
MNVNILALNFLFFCVFGLPQGNSKGCSLGIILDPYFGQQYGTSANNIVLSSISRVSKIYGDNFGIELKVGTIIPLGREYLPLYKSGHAKDLLRTVQNDVSNNVFRNQGIYPGSHCLLQLFTFQDFGVNLGQSYNGDASGGVCSRYYNIGAINTMVNNRPATPDILVKTIAHEIGHSFGASHDSNQCSNPTSPYIMNANIRGGANSENFSICSKDLIWNNIRRKSACFNTL